MVDERLRADPRRRVDLDSAHRASRVGHRHGHHRETRLVERVGGSVDEDRLHPAPAREDLERADAARRGIALPRGGEIATHLAGYPPQQSEPKHVLKVKAGRDRGATQAGWTAIPRTPFEARMRSAVRAGAPLGD